MGQSEMSTRPTFTRSLAAWQAGDDAALERLLPVVYEQLKSIAHRKLRHEREGHTLNTTALVHEAYVKLVDQTSIELNGRAHFFGIAARAMQQVLIDSARRFGTAKRGGGWQRIVLDDTTVSVEERADALLALDDALERLARISTRMSRVVQCRFFGGMTEAETAVALGVSERTVRREWLKAKLWLYSDLVEDATPSAATSAATQGAARAGGRV